MGGKHVLSLAVLVVGAPAWAAPPKLEVPSEVRPAGEYARFTPVTDGSSVLYVGLSGLDPFPTEELKDGKRFLLPVRGVPAGRYKFAAVAANKAGEQSRADFVVVVGDAPAPVPPGPDPVIPPVPVDPLVKLLADAFGTEAAPDKRERVRALADVMREAARLSDRADLDTNAALTAAVTVERRAKVGESLPAVRKAIGAYMGGEFSPDPFTLNGESRAKFKAAYSKLAAALDVVGK